jgi:hypothetical protein
MDEQSGTTTQPERTRKKAKYRAYLVGDDGKLTDLVKEFDSKKDAVKAIAETGRVGTYEIHRILDRVTVVPTSGVKVTVG